jgi:type IV pilus assembly protein PilA
MREQLRKRLEGRTEEGFTLIELMVVVLIIAILLAIAIPSFLGARGKAQDRASQSNLRNALTAEKTFYTDNQVYSVDPTAMKAIEPSLNYVTGTPAQGSNDVQLVKGNATTGVTTAVTDGVICLTSMAANGNTFAIKDVAAGTNAGTYFFKAAIATCNDSTGPTKW